MVSRCAGPTCARVGFEGSTLMRSTREAFPQVAPSSCACVHVLDHDVSAGQAVLRAGFDSRQLHQLRTGQDESPGPSSFHIKIPARPYSEMKVETRRSCGRRTGTERCSRWPRLSRFRWEQGRRRRSCRERSLSRCRPPLHVNGANVPIMLTANSDQPPHVQLGGLIEFARSTRV